MLTFKVNTRNSRSITSDVRQKYFIISYFACHATNNNKKKINGTYKVNWQQSVKTAVANCIKFFSIFWVISEC